MALGAFCYHALTDHQVASVALPSRGLYGSEVTGLAHEGFECLLFGPGEDVGLASCAPQVGTIQLEVMDPFLWLLLGIQKLLNHRHPGRSGGLVDDRLGAFFGHGLLDLLEQAFHMDLAPALCALSAASVSLPRVTLMIRILKQVSDEILLLLHQRNASMWLTFRFLLQKVMWISEQQIHPFCGHKEDVSQVFIRRLLVSKEVIGRFFTSSMLCHSFDGLLQCLSCSDAFFSVIYIFILHIYSRISVSPLILFAPDPRRPAALLRASAGYRGPETKSSHDVASQELYYKQDWLMSYLDLPRNVF